MNEYQILSDYFEDRLSDTIKREVENGWQIQTFLFTEPRSEFVALMYRPLPDSTADKHEAFVEDGRTAGDLIFGG